MTDPGPGTAPTRDQLEQHLAEDQLALRRGQEQSLRIAATLEKSQRVPKAALRRLRRAGLVR